MARSNNNNKLKAFVRFDGSGRIIPSSLIVQAFKPKVGNYQEIDAKECCNYVPPTTTSTTTVAPTTTSTTTVAPTTTTTTTVEPTTTTTTTAAPGYVTWSFAESIVSAEDACNGGSGLVTLYSATSPLTNGMVLYSDTALTIPVNSGWYVNPSNSTVYEVGVEAPGVIFSQALCSSITTTTTTTEFPGYYTWLMGRGTDAATACAETSLAPVYSSVSPLNIGVFLYTDTALTISVPNDWYAVGGVAYQANNGDGEIVAQSPCP